MNGLTIKASNHNHVVSVLGRLVINVWRGLIDVPGIQATDEAIYGILRHAPEMGYGAITVVEPSIVFRFSEEARAASTALQERWKNRMSCSAYLVAGNSFMMASTRTLVAGIVLVTRSPYPFKVFDDPLQTADWVARHVDIPPDMVVQALLETRNAPAD